MLSNLEIPRLSLRILSRKPIVILTLLVLLGTVVPESTAQSKCQPPALAANPANLFTEEQEMVLGDAVASHIESSFRVIDDEEVTGYLRRVGQRLIAQIPSTKLRFQFYVVDSYEVNAFTLPGGRIYITRKLIAFANNEDELAGVVAHELGHVVARHTANDMSVLFRELLGVTEVRDRRDIFAKYQQFIDTQMLKPKVFEKLGAREDRDQYGADMIGLYLLANAGYDVQAQAGFWDRYHVTKKKTGSFFSNLFGTTKPEQKRLAEMFRQLSLLPAECKQLVQPTSREDFARWQATVVRYKGLGRKESLTGVVKKARLDPPLRSSIYHIRFSPDGKYLLAQDDAGISLMTREPFAPLFRISAPDAYAAEFTPDSREVVFYTPNLRVENWGIADQSLHSANEVVVRGSCLQTRISSNGKTLGCLDDNGSILLIDVEESTILLEKKSFSTPNFFELLSRLGSIFASRGRIPEEGNFVNMAFSPDAHYFLAGDLTINWTSLGSYTEDKAFGFDLTQRVPLPIKGDIKKLAISGFAFVGSDKIVGSYYGDNKKAGLYSFPSGTVIERFDVVFRMKPVTKGNYVLIPGSWGFGGSVFDLNVKKYFRAADQPLLDVFEDVGAAETQNGELVLYGLKGQAPKALVIPENPLGRLYAADFSPDLKYLALSGSARGAVWNLEEGQMLIYMRGFRGVGFGEDGLIYMDFPPQDPSPRGIAQFDPVKRAIARGPAVKSESAVQYGSVLIRSRPEMEVIDGKEKFDWSKGLSTIEVYDTRTMSLAWSQKFAQEFPSYLPDSFFNTVVLAWWANSKAAAAEVQDDPRLGKRLGNSKENESVYFFKILDLKTGKTLGKLLVDTNQKSFRILDAIATGDYFVAMDNQNRTLIYSLSTGLLLGRVFGNRATLSPAAKLLCVENESGQLLFYDLGSFEKRGQLTFSDRVKMVRFSADGKRLGVLTANQTVSFFDVGAVTR